MCRVTGRNPISRALAAKNVIAGFPDAHKPMNRLHALSSPPLSVTFAPTPNATHLNSAMSAAISGLPNNSICLPGWFRGWVSSGVFQPQQNQGSGVSSLANGLSLRAECAIAFASPIPKYATAPRRGGNSAAVGELPDAAN